MVKEILLAILCFWAAIGCLEFIWTTIHVCRREELMEKYDGMTIIEWFSSLLLYIIVGPVMIVLKLVHVIRILARR